MEALRPSCARLLAALLLLAPGASATPTQEGVRAVLARRVPVETRTAAELTDGLVALGAAAVPALYELATGRGMEALVGGEWLPGAWSCEPEAIPALCASALERATDARVVLAQLAQALDARPNDHERLLILRILAGQGSAAGLELVLRSATELGDLELLRPRVRSGLRAALSAILGRDPRAFEPLRARLSTLEPSTREVLVEALGAAGRKQGMPLLTRMFVAGEPARLRVAEAMAELEGARPWDLGGETMKTCSALLRSPEAEERALAARLVGDLHALDAIPELLTLAHDPEALVQRCARASLASLAEHAPADPEAWEAWYQREEVWRSEQWKPLLDTLTAQDPGAANAALTELTLHSLYRHEAAEALAESLLEQPPIVAVATCAMLESLRSRRALPGLVDALEKGPSQLKAAAWRALRAISGRQHELSPKLWQAMIDS